ncbi:hypothetical protein P7C73_g5952, partial [Tremellales sp. Uapishka_1]
TPFQTPHRFSIPIPSAFLPGSLDLSSVHRGEIRWALIVKLELVSGKTYEEIVRVDGTPQELEAVEGQLNEQVEDVLERDGVRCRLVMDTAAPRLGQLLRVGVEIKPKARERTNVGGLSMQPNPADTLRPLRRVRVELIRRVSLPAEAQSSTSSSTAEEQGGSSTHTTPLHSSGKSLRYPGPNPAYPPLRVLFTLPSQFPLLATGADPTWGEVSMETPYHHVRFFVKVTMGFGTPSDSLEMKEWVLEKEIQIRPRAWREPREVVVEGGRIPQLGIGFEEESHDEREAYRRKGRDVVGNQGTTRPLSTHSPGSDLPPPFETEQASEAGPSAGASAAGGLPSFLESEEQMRLGEAPLPSHEVRSERLVPVEFDEAGPPQAAGSGHRELATWVEYDGYETFSEQPPPAAVSFGVGGSMDPPTEGDPAVPMGDLMESLGLGEGTRVVDLHDDLPPGIDEPSLPALPDFAAPHHHHLPPSFDASEAAEAARPGNQPAGRVEAPPGYFGQSTGASGLPPYS